MAEYRKVQTSLWEDDWFYSLEMDERLLYLYLQTNPGASVAGIYKRPLRYIALETKFPPERVREILEKFQADGKILVDFEHGVIWVFQMREKQKSQSPFIEKAIASTLEQIPDCEVKKRYIAYYDGGDDTEQTESPDSIEGVSRESQESIGELENRDREGIRDREGDREKDFTPAAGGRGADAPAPPPAPPAPVSENLAEQARKPPERAQNPLPRAPSGAETSAKAPKARAKRGGSAPDGRSTRARPELSAIISEFVDRSGISPPANKRELRSWYSAAQEMLSEFGDPETPGNPGPVLALMRRFFEARERGEEWAQFTISSPRSLMKTFRAMRANQVRTRASPGARKPKPSVYEQNMAALRQVLAEEGS